MTTRMKRIPVKFIRQAEPIARQAYFSVYHYDDDCKCWGGVNPELSGCMAQGKTLEDARIDLYEARVTYIASLLEDGLEVPQPKGYASEAVWMVTDGVR